jgi:uncharacterized protein YuzE
MSEQIVVKVDQAAGAAYIRFNHNPVASTVEHGEDIAIDLDEYSMVVGIEVLSLDADLPFQSLITDYHVESSKIELLRLLRPSISGFITLSTSAQRTAPAPAAAPAETCP